MIDLFLPETAQLSNTVLVAILPFISDFSAKLKLPVITPVQVTHVAAFKGYTLKDNPGGFVILTNGYKFSFGHGHVEQFTAPDAYFHLQDVERVPEFVGESRMSKKEAIVIVETAIQQIGYDLADVFADVPPKVQGPTKIRKKVIPRYLVTWSEPREGHTSVDAEVNGETRRIESLSLGGSQLWRDPPIPVPPPGVSDTWLAAVSLKASNFAHQASLPFPLPIQRSQLDVCSEMRTLTDYNLVLTNGYTIGSSLSGDLFGLRWPDAFYGGRLVSPIRRYHGAWKVSQRQAIETARHVVRKLDSSMFDYVKGRPEVIKPQQMGSRVIPRYQIRWNSHASVEADVRNSGVQVEIHGETGKVLLLTVADPNLPSLFGGSPSDKNRIAPPRIKPEIKKVAPKSPKSSD